MEEVFDRQTVYAAHRIVDQEHGVFRAPVKLQFTVYYTKEQLNMI